MKEVAEANKIPKNRKPTVIRLAVLFVGSLILCFTSAAFFYQDDVANAVFLLGGIGTFLGLIGSVAFSIALAINASKMWGESLAEKARQEQVEEDARLQKIRETMSPAEWETYKLQLENNKLLKQIKNSKSSKKTTTTFGFIDEL